MSLADKNILIFGATGGVGSTLAASLREKGARLYLASRDQERVSALSAALDQTGSVCDVREANQVESTVASAVEALGGLDGVVNCAGSVLLKPAHLTPEEQWQETLSVNLSSSFFILKYAVAHLRASSGSLVLIASAAAQLGLPNHEAIAAAKAGIIGLARSAAASYARSGVRVNVVSPGLVETKLTEAITKSESSRKVSLAMHPVGRLGSPEDIISGIEWLLDPSQSWVTGQVIGIDGGLASLKSH